MKNIIIDKGKNPSNPYNLNLLFQIDNIYVMDNHLAAIWCWLQKIDVNSNYRMLHIDAHYDFLESQLNDWINELKKQKIDLENISIQDLIKIKYKINNEDYQLFRYDNYLSIFNSIYPNLLKWIKAVTHKKGDKIDENLSSDIEFYDLNENIAYWINKTNEKWIINIDIDYFFEENSEKFTQIFTDEYILKFTNQLRSVKEKIEVITIALSPQFCGGWENSERVAKLILDNLLSSWYE